MVKKGKGKPNQEVNKKILKGVKNKRQGEIYAYFKKELLRQDKSQGGYSQYFSPREETIYDKFNSQVHFIKTYRLNRQGQHYLLKQTNQAYREEQEDKKLQLRYYKSNIGSSYSLSPELTKKDKFKYFFPEKGEHKDFFKRKKEFKSLWNEKTKTYKGKRIKNKEELLKIYEELYYKSPWRIRDRFLVPTGKKGTSFSTLELYEKYVKNNPFPATRKYYRQALSEWVRQGGRMKGEKVPNSEIVTNKHGQIVLQEGQELILIGDKPGRKWNLYKNVVPMETRAKKEFHDWAQESYIENEGSELERQVWGMKTNKGLCWVEYLGLGNCKLNQGTSGWFCLDCVSFGEFHPPVLPKHCSWLYTYKTWQCGNRNHPDANKQWHFSVEGERIRDKIKGGDWGSCHIGTFGRPTKRKDRVRKKNWVI